MEKSYYTNLTVTSDSYNAVIKRIHTLMMTLKIKGMMKVHHSQSDISRLFTKYLKASVYVISFRDVFLGRENLSLRFRAIKLTN